MKRVMTRKMRDAAADTQNAPAFCTPRTVPALFRAATAVDPGRPWLEDEHQTLTLGACAEKVANCAAGLAAAGARPGDRVALILPNSPDMVVCWLAIAEAGCVSVPLNPALTNAELTGILGHCGARLVITDDDGAARLAAELPAAGWPPISSIDRMLTRADRSAGMTSHAKPNDPVTVLYSSGTTGAPKGIVLPHRALVLAAEATAFALAADDDDVFLTTNPLFHVNAIAYAVLASLAARARVVVLSRFSSSGLMAQCHRTSATVLVLAAAAIPMWWERLREEPPEPNRLRAILSGGAPPAIFADVEARLGLRIHTGYALSESPLGLLAPRPGAGEARPSPGLGLPPVHPDPEVSCEAMIADEDGQPLSRGEHGEILLRNPALMLGYLDDDAATAAAMADGWLRTGDIGYLDDSGYFFFVSRKKEMLRRKGEMISPAEIETVLRELSGVRDAAVAGRQSELGIGEERIVAFIETDANSELTEEAVRAWCQPRLAAHKHPDTIVLCASFPRNALDKVQKKRLLAEHMNDASSPADIRSTR